MERKRGLSRSQKICIVLLWTFLCVMLFTFNTSKSLGENIFIAVASGVIIIVGIISGQKKEERRRRGGR